MSFDMSVVGKEFGPYVHHYTFKDVILYALSVGAKADEIDYLYEQRGPKVLPSFAVIPTLAPMLDLFGKSGGDLSTVLHGGQRIELFDEIPSEGELLTYATVRGIYDLKRLASIRIDTRTVRSQSAREVFLTRWSILVRGAGGFGGQVPPREEACIPALGALPNWTIEQQTSKEQAMLYRLNGDLNPLHIDAAIASQVGFTQGPILHGLCTLGFMVRAAMKLKESHGFARLRFIEAQFRKPVWPGETLVTSAYELDPNRFALQVHSKERNEMVISHAGVSFL